MDPRDLLPWLGARVPLRLASAAAWLAAWIWWWVLPVRRSVAVDNLRQALPDAPVRATLTRMMHDIVLGYVELLRWDREVRRGLPPTVIVEIPPLVQPGSLILSGHGGMWDLLVLAMARYHTMAIFLRPPTEPWARERLRDLREAHGVHALVGRASMADAYAALEAGENVCFVQDQAYAKGVASPFFGRPAMTSLGFAAALLATGRPAWGCWPVRVGLGHHRLDVAPFEVPPLTGDREADLQAVTDATNRWYEAHIRARPHGWLWLHRRWKPGATPRA